MIMECHNIDTLENTTTQSTKFKPKIWVEINDDLRRTYNIISQIKVKASTLKTS